MIILLFVQREAYMKYVPWLINKRPEEFSLDWIEIFVLNAATSDMIH